MGQANHQEACVRPERTARVILCPRSYMHASPIPATNEQTTTMHGVKEVFLDAPAALPVCDFMSKEGVT